MVGGAVCGGISRYFNPKETILFKVTITDRQASFGRVASLESLTEEELKPYRTGIS
jgi:hypothetical protein